MHQRLHDNWTAVLTARGGATALVDAESGLAWTFHAVERLAIEWLESYGRFSRSEGQVWCLSLTDRVAWLSVFLAAIKAGAVVLPLEPGNASALRELVERKMATLLIDDAGVHALGGAEARKGAFLIKRTSGTTGDPKVLPFTEAEMMADGRQIMRTMAISERDRNFAILPLGHSYGLGNLVMPFFMDGVGMVLGSSPYPQVIAEELTQFPCSILPLVPPLVKAMAQVSFGRRLPSELRLVISAGGVLLEEVAQRFYENTGLYVHNFYGSTETGGICFVRSRRGVFIDGGVGEAIEGVELLIGEDQSIQVRSDALCHAVYPEGVCTLHDFGRLDGAGVLHLIGRHSDVVKVAGHRVSLSEIEAMICALDQVTDAYVSSRVGRSGETRCVALFCGEARAEALKAALQSKVPHWKVPQVLFKVERVLYNARGKKDRTAMEAILDAAIAR